MASPARNLTSTRLWSVKQFKDASSIGWGRSHLQYVDKKLAQAHAAEGTPTAYLEALCELIDECRLYTITKRNKYKRTIPNKCKKRLEAVDALMKQAFEILKAYAFQERKSQGPRQNLVGLKSGYDKERKEFEAMKANTPNNQGLRLDPRSASFVQGGLEQFARNLWDVYARYWGQTLLRKNIDEMTDDEFKQISKELAVDGGRELEERCALHERVHYIRKQERINNNMLIPIGGLLYKETGHHPYNTANSDIYAIDKYGNLMCAPANSTFRSDGGDRKNFSSELRHSSLNAGNGVICAGIIKIEQGKVAYIDNRSGHYKPTEKDLARGVACLMTDHSLDLSQTKIVSFVATGVNSMPKLGETIGGQAFMSKVVPPPPGQPF